MSKLLKDTHSRNQSIGSLSLLIFNLFDVFIHFSCFLLPKVAELSPEPSDLTSKEQTQTSIKQSTGSNFFLNKKDVIVIKGRLNKKSESKN